MQGHLYLEYIHPTKASDLQKRVGDVRHFIWTAKQCIAKWFSILNWLSISLITVGIWACQPRAVLPLERGDFPSFSTLTTRSGVPIICGGSKILLVLIIQRRLGEDTSVRWRLWEIRRSRCNLQVAYHSIPSHPHINRLTHNPVMMHNQLLDFPLVEDAHLLYLIFLLLPYIHRCNSNPHQS